MRVLNAKTLSYWDLNRMLKGFLERGEKEILVKNVEGQRYIGDGIEGNYSIIIEGTPGNDMAAYMNGPSIVVRGSAQDAAANTMNSGEVIVYGSAGDAAGYGMRGGEVYIKGNVGYRVGIHMKEYSDKKPVIVIGGNAGDFLGEYMAGGIIILLGLNEKNNREVIGNYCGTGMHGGTIYVRDNVDVYKLGKEVGHAEANDKDISFISAYIKKFSNYFDYDYNSIMDRHFTKLYAYNKRPYGNFYAY